MSKNKLEVWMDTDFLGEIVKVGTLAHDRGHIRFVYTKDWIKHPNTFDIDPDLSLDNATFGGIPTCQ